MCVAPPVPIPRQAPHLVDDSPEIPYLPGSSPRETAAHEGALLQARAVRRRPSLLQGRALESLGHAVEYLVDSRLFLTGEIVQHDEQDAVQILMQLSRAVFAECTEVVPFSQRLSTWVSGRIPYAGG